jgi:hypothetical protein
MSTTDRITDHHHWAAGSQPAYRTDDAVLGYRAGAIDDSLIRAFEAIDRKTMRAYRLARLREQLRAHDYAGMLLADPLNIRYATDTNNLGLWVMHSPSR